MILGLSLSTFTALHVLISLVGVGAGLAVLFGMIASKRLDALTAIFLATTVATSVTGFFFHSAAFGPPHILGVISLPVLGAAIYARYPAHMAGKWRAVYVICSAFALYLNCFVAVVQAFQKVAPLHALAPNGSGPPFAVAQIALLVAFIVTGRLALKRFHP